MQLKTSGNSPRARGELDAEQTAIRKSFVELISGERALKMGVEKAPIDADAQIELQQAMSGAFTGDGNLNVRACNDSSAG